MTFLLTNKAAKRQRAENIVYKYIDPSLSRSSRKNNPTQKFTTCNFETLLKKKEIITLGDFSLSKEEKISFLLQEQTANFLHDGHLNHYVEKIMLEWDGWA